MITVDLYPVSYDNNNILIVVLFITSIMNAVYMYMYLYIQYKYVPI